MSNTNTTTNEQHIENMKANRAARLRAAAEQLANLMDETAAEISTAETEKKQAHAELTAAQKSGDFLKIAKAKARFLETEERHRNVMFHLPEEAAAKVKAIRREVEKGRVGRKPCRPRKRGHGNSGTAEIRDNDRCRSAEPCRKGYCERQLHHGEDDCRRSRQEVCSRKSQCRKGRLSPCVHHSTEHRRKPEAAGGGHCGRYNPAGVQNNDDVRGGAGTHGKSTCDPAGIRKTGSLCSPLPVPLPLSISIQSPK